MTFGARIAGLGMDVPVRIVTNKDLEAVVDTTDDWIVTRTGIHERRIVADGQSTGDLAVKACEDALRSAGITIADIEMIVLSTCTGDTNMLPATATFVQTALGASHIPAFDISAACSGFVYGLDIAHQFIATGRCRRILVVGAEAMSRVVDWTDRASCVLFGDGAGAAILKPVQSGYGVLYSRLYADGSHADILNIQGGGSRQPFTKAVLDNKSHFIHMQGRAVFKVAVTAVLDALQTALTAIGRTPEDLALFIPHQANLRIVEYVREKMGLTEAQCFTNLQQYGNTSAASIPIALCEAYAQGRICDGDLIALVGFGAGFTWGVNLIRWGGYS